MIGRALRALRIKHGLTIRQLSELTGLPINAISHVEAQIENPEINDAINKICTKLNTPVAYLHLMAAPLNDIPKSKQFAFKLLHKALIDLLINNEE